MSATYQRFFGAAVEHRGSPTKFLRLWTVVVSSGGSYVMFYWTLLWLLCSGIESGVWHLGWSMESSAS